MQGNDLLRAARGLAVAIFQAVQVQVPRISRPAASLERWQQQLAAFRRLPDRKLRSSRAWDQLARQSLLPAVRDWAAELQQQGLEQSRRQAASNQLLTAGALAVRPCANPGCTNLAGCSEGRLRVRRCSGCRAVRYCSRACQQEDWASHSKLCGRLADILASGALCEALACGPSTAAARHS